MAGSLPGAVWPPLFMAMRHQKARGAPREGGGCQRQEPQACASFCNAGRGRAQYILSIHQRSTSHCCLLDHIARTGFGPSWSLWRERRRPERCLREPHTLLVWKGSQTAPRAAACSGPIRDAPPSRGAEYIRCPVGSGLDGGQLGSSDAGQALRDMCSPGQPADPPSLQITQDLVPGAPSFHLECLLTMCIFTMTRPLSPPCLGQSLPEALWSWHSCQDNHLRSVWVWTVTSVPPPTNDLCGCVREHVSPPR